ncbi:TIGR04283 family arsenosugar biosynthesis glycosyltransferase [Spiribacter onubensis]|uniref:Glycosyltransferase family 2 protein n=1 Tax=Spiribacter onubensis TaxID=3122420 RepID=A0ABV3S9F9_9GAMM
MAGRAQTVAMRRFSIIIPVAPDEDQWQTLLDDIAGLPGPLEVILVSSAGDGLDESIGLIHGKRIRSLQATPGRGPQMNAGAWSSSGDYLWFLHADSRLTPGSMEALQQAIDREPGELFYFDLAFRDGSPWLMSLSSLGANLRSRWLKVPFGDQGFCIARERFHSIGGFPEDLPHGEDHVFVWRARQEGIDVRPVGEVIHTSARKYVRHGWLRTTLNHQSIWLRQAWPEWKRLRRRRAG